MPDTKYSDLPPQPVAATDRFAVTRDPTGSPVTQGAEVQGVLDFVENNATAFDPAGSAATVQGNLDTHTSDTANPHSTDIGNLGTGTLAELNSKVTDATLDDASAARPPQNHAATHTDGTDDIQSATGVLKGLLTAVAQTIGGVKTFLSNWVVSNSNPGFRLFDTDGSADNKIIDVSGGTGDLTISIKDDAELFTALVLQMQRTGINVDLIQLGGGADVAQLSAHPTGGTPLAIASTQYVDNSVKSPGGSDTEIQYNNSGVFAGAPMTTDGTDIDVKTGSKFGVADLNSGDQVITTDTNGELQESGAKVETAPSGGSGIAVVEYASPPVSPPTGMFWIERVDANTVRHGYFDGTQNYYVEMTA